MRRNLLETFDSIYVLDLHGDSKKKEVCKDGSPDQNVFDIMQGVSINIFIKNGVKQKNKLGKVYHFDLQGKRNIKYAFLNKNSLKNIKWSLLETKEPNYFFIDKDFSGQNKYNKGFKIDEIFLKYNNGIETGKDLFFYGKSKEELKAKLENLFYNKPETINNYKITNTSSFQFQDKFNSSTFDHKKIRPVSYRPFDIVSSYYDENLQRRPAFTTMKHMFSKNIGLLVPRQFSGDFKHIFISKYPTDCNLTGTAKKFGSSPLIPLYLYPETNGQHNIEETTKRKPNLNLEIVTEIADKLGLTFTNEKENSENTLAPIDILDYIYGVLHSPNYRDKYKEFLKIDFPRVPYPKDKDTFWKLVKLGGEIRQIHLLESQAVENYITTYPKDGSNTITTKVSKKDWELFDIEKEIGRIWINEDQYFDNVPLLAWEFYIGGYQPAQKWLKDRRERTLEIEDILHYQKIIVALSETDRLMKEIDKIEIVSN